MKNSVYLKRNLTKVFLAVFSLCISTCLAENGKTLSPDRYRQIQEITSSSRSLLFDLPLEYSFDWERITSYSQSLSQTKKVYRIDGKDAQGILSKYQVSTFTDTNGTSNTEGYITYKNQTYILKKVNGVKKLTPNHQKRIDFDYIKFIIDYPNMVFQKAQEKPEVIKEDDSQLTLRFSLPNEEHTSGNLVMTLDKTKNYALKSFVTSLNDKVQVEDHRKYENFFIPTAITATNPFPSKTEVTELWKFTNLSFKALSHQEFENRIKEKFQLWGGK